MDLTCTIKLLKCVFSFVRKQKEFQNQTFGINPTLDMHFFFLHKIIKFKWGKGVLPCGFHLYYIQIHVAQDA